MDKAFKPSRLDLSPDSSSATRQYRHWLRTFENFLSTLKLPESYSSRVGGDVTVEMVKDQMQLDALTNFVSAEIWADIKDCTTYVNAIMTLNELFIKQPSEVFARYKLATTKQDAGQSLESFRRTLDRLSRDCNFSEVNATRYREDMVLQAFIAGISSNDIRKRLLEEKELTLDSAFKLAVTRHDSHKEACLYEQSGTNLPIGNMSLATVAQASTAVTAAVGSSFRCGYCGSTKYHPRARCPAKRSECRNCHKMGHWESVCKGEKAKPRSNRTYTTAAVMPADESSPYEESSSAYTDHVSLLCANSTSMSPACLKYATVDAFINNRKCAALIDSGSSCSYINSKLAKELKLAFLPSKALITLADTSAQNKVSGTCNINITINEISHNLPVGILDNLCADVILGGDFLQKHNRVIFQFNSKGGDFVINNQKVFASCRH